jgi:hypothetical protein
MFAAVDWDKVASQEELEEFAEHTPAKDIDITDNLWLMPSKLATWQWENNIFCFRINPGIYWLIYFSWDSFLFWKKIDGSFFSRKEKKLSAKERKNTWNN